MRMEFAAAAPKSDGYVFDYEREVAAFYTAHPHQRTRVFFVDAVNRLLMGKSFIDEEATLARLRCNDGIVNRIKMSQETGTCMTLSFINHYCILMNTEAPMKGGALSIGDASLHVRNAYVFDHEIGHAICEEAMGFIPNRSECIADSYALLRQIQRFGKDGVNFIKDVIDQRAVELVFRDDMGNHFTSPVARKILNDSVMHDFAALSPEETRAKAYEYGIRYALAEKEPAILSRHFYSFKHRLPQIAEGNEAPLEQLADIVLRESTPEQFRWGGIAAQTLIEGKVQSPHGGYIQPKGGKWAEIWHEIAAKQAGYRREKPASIASFVPKI